MKANKIDFEERLTQYPKIAQVSIQHKATQQKDT